MLVDLGSTNGTSVNGSQVEEHELQYGDRITLGNVVFEYLPYEPRRAAS
jgi:pSer/pThr/pTyr-binding forkhead associated (FHA) protein